MLVGWLYFDRASMDSYAQGPPTALHSGSGEREKLTRSLPCVTQKYRDRINALKNAKSLRLVVDLNHLRSDGRGDLAGRLMRRPAPYVCALREAARDVALAMDPAFNKTLKEKIIHIGFEGRCGTSLVGGRRHTRC